MIDCDDCFAVFKSGMAFRPRHVDTLGVLATHREDASYLQRAKDWGLNITWVEATPADFGMGAVNRRTVGVYEDGEAAMCAFMWLHHFNVVRNWRLSLKLRTIDAGSPEDTRELLDWRIGRQGPGDYHRCELHPNSHYGSFENRLKKQKIPGTALVYTTTQGRWSQKQVGSKAWLKQQDIVSGDCYADLKIKWKAHGEKLKGRTALDWDIRRGYLHVVPR